MLPLVSYLLFALAAFIGYFFLSGFIWGAGYYPTSAKEIDTVVRLLDLKPNWQFYDLGSGYGRMIIRVAQKSGAHAVGVEVDPIKVWWTRRTIRRKGLEKQVEVIRSNFLDLNLADADAIFVFLSSEGKIMDRLYSKINLECRPGTKIVSFEHKFKSWESTQNEGRLFLYQVTKQNVESSSS